MQLGIACKLNQFRTHYHCKLTYNYISGLAPDDRGVEAAERKPLGPRAGQGRQADHADHHQDGRLLLHLGQLYQVRLIDLNSILFDTGNISIIDLIPHSVKWTVKCYLIPKT